MLISNLNTHTNSLSWWLDLDCYQGKQFVRLAPQGAYQVFHVITNSMIDSCCIAAKVDDGFSESMERGGMSRSLLIETINAAVEAGIFDAEAWEENLIVCDAVTEVIQTHYEELYD
ncbi:MAG: hypothetical protein QNJ46_06020 [Leptolyngbyaceae cyanobacterium MO_188.B28]|nr:hypothetical protein [Leptolyngbyaceae cyanobacterium MO_188.B28]